MMHRLCCLLIFLPAFAAAQNQLNVTLEAQVNRGDTRYSGCWGYHDAAQREYALLGARTGTAVYDLEAEPEPAEVAFIPGPVTRWREITVIGDHAFVVTDVEGAGHAMQVIDLTTLPDTATLLTTFDSTFTKGHIIQKQLLSPGEEPYVYVAGATTTDGVHILDVSDPAHPAEIGRYAPGYYIHDCHVRGNHLFAAAFYHSTIDIVDITDKTNPALVTQLPIPGGAVHSATSSIDGDYLFIASEQDGLPGRIWHIGDLDNPYEVATYTANPASLVHNPYVRDHFAYVAHNTEGLRVVDLSDPEVPVEVGYYDTYDGPSGGFNGLWSACPYFPSGRIIGGNREDGLYVWQFNGQRAGRFYGTVTDSLTGAPLYQATVTLEEQAVVLTPDATFKGGALPGSYTLQVTAPGYLPKTIILDLAAADQLQLAVALAPEVSNTGSIAPTDSVVLAPNPFRRETILHLPYPDHPFRQLQLYDAAGRLRRTIETHHRKTLTIRREDLPPGLYFLTARDRKKMPIRTWRLIILP